MRPTPDCRCWVWLRLRAMTATGERADRAKGCAATRYQLLQSDPRCQGRVMDGSAPGCGVQSCIPVQPSPRLCPTVAATQWLAVCCWRVIGALTRAIEEVDRLQRMRCRCRGQLPIRRIRQQGWIGCEVASEDGLGLGCDVCFWWVEVLGDEPFPSGRIQWRGMPWEGDNKDTPKNSGCHFVCTPPSTTLLWR